MPKGNRRVRIKRNEGEEAALGSCSRESLQRLFPVPKLGVQGGKSLPGGFSHLGSCLTPHPQGAALLWAGREWGDRSPCPPRAGGDVPCHPLLQEQLGPSFNCVNLLGLEKLFTFTLPCVWFVIAAEQEGMLWVSRSQQI